MGGIICPLKIKIQEGIFLFLLKLILTVINIRLSATIVPLKAPIPLNRSKEFTLFFSSERKEVISKNPHISFNLNDPKNCKEVAPPKDLPIYTTLLPLIYREISTDKGHTPKFLEVPEKGIPEIPRSGTEDKILL